jgi:hypothetical protein
MHMKIYLVLLQDTTFHVLCGNQGVLLKLSTQAVVLPDQMHDQALSVASSLHVAA